MDLNHKQSMNVASTPRTCLTNSWMLNTTPGSASLVASEKGYVPIIQKRIECQHYFKIRIGSQIIPLPLSGEIKTCGDLLRQVKLLYHNLDPKFKKEGSEIVALRTESGIETMDYYLTLEERPLNVLSSTSSLCAVFASTQHLTRQTGYSKKRISRKHFEMIKMIGKGGFSNVYEVRHKKSGRIYAMKVIEKELLEKEGKIRQVMNEKWIMQVMNHPYVVKMYWSFQSKHKLQFVMDFCAGGELFYHLHNVGRLSESQAKFYATEVLLGIEYLHKNGIIYRDLKPENVFLDIDGHARIADFGLSKDNNKLSSVNLSFCGSPEYMSPEMLKETGHNFTVDYYSFGALIYEMIFGLPPHYSTNQDEMYDRILHDPLNIPGGISLSLRDFLIHLLKKNPKERMGSKRGCEELKAHSWWKDTDWKAFMERRVDPPFKPALSKSHFDPEFTTAPTEGQYKKTERSMSYYHDGSNAQSFIQSEASEYDIPTEGKYQDFSFERSDPIERNGGNLKR